MKHARDDEQTVQRLLEKAAAGDSKAAWVLIFFLVDALDTLVDEVSTAPTLFKFAADFFEELLQIRSSKGGKKPTRAEYAKAFDKLHILERNRGRQKLDEISVVKRFAAESKLREDGKSADDARAELEAKGVAAAVTLRDQRTSRPDLADLANTLTPAERDALADDVLADKQ